MSKIDEQISNWRKNWLTSLFEFSHLSFQHKLWIEASFHDYIGGYGEDMCRYFDDLDLHENYENEINEGYVSKEEYYIIKEFHSMLSDYDERGMMDTEILKDKNWIEITEVGLKCWEVLKSKIKEPSELEYIKGMEIKYL